MHRNRIVALLIAALSIFGVSLATAMPASASYTCDGHWLYASWGRGCALPSANTVQTQDLLTDGYCVDAKWYDRTYGVWRHITSTTNCGGGVSTGQTNDHTCIRLYREDGRYLTLRRDSTYCP